MMYKRIANYIFSIAIGLVALSACEKVIEDFDFLQSEPKLVVNAPFIADSTIIIHVSQTMGIMEDDKFNFVSNASAELYSEENLLSTASYLDSGLYAFDVLPLAGNTYTLRVVSPDLPATEATIDMPAQPALESIEYIGWEDNGCRLNISINDPGDSRNAYGVSLKAAFGWFEFDDLGNITDTTIDVMEYAYLLSSDINVSGGFWEYSLSTQDWGDYFSGNTLLIEDDFVNGKEFSVGITAQELYFTISIEEPVLLSLEAYSEDYIKYLKSMELYDNSIDNPIAEKVTIFTNIDGGLGMAYGKTISRYEYTLPPEALDGYEHSW